MLYNKKILTGETLDFFLSGHQSLYCTARFIIPSFIEWTVHCISVGIYGTCCKHISCNNIINIRLDQICKNWLLNYSYKVIMMLKFKVTLRKGVKNYFLRDMYTKRMAGGGAPPCAKINFTKYKKIIQHVFFC